MKTIFTKAVSVTLAATMVLTSMVIMPGVAVETQAAAKSSNYKLVWSDEFNGKTLNTNNWNYSIGNSGDDGNNPGWGNNESQYYTNSEKNLSLSNGILNITAHEELTEGYAYSSARINTSGKQSFKYGRMEARIKLPSLDGVWPAFWMLGVNQRGWPWCGEIDILEAWNTYQFAQGAFHWNQGVGENSFYDPQYSYSQLNAISSRYKWFDKTQWHIYAVEWDSKYIRYFVDNTEYYKVDITTADKKDEGNKAYYFVLNVAVGGNLPAMTPVKGTLPATMQVDYVRAYQKDSDNGYKNSKWTEQNQVKKYTVKLKSRGKTLATALAFDGETINFPNVKRSKYVLKGWYSNGKKVTAKTRVRANMTVTAKWTKVSVKKATLKTAKSKKKGMAYLKYKVKNGAKGYQAKYGRNKKLKKYKTSSTTSKKITIPFLKSGKKYYFSVRAYKFDSKKKKVYGKWSKVKSVTIK